MTVSVSVVSLDLMQDVDECIDFFDTYLYFLTDECGAGGGVRSLHFPLWYGKEKNS